MFKQVLSISNEQNLWRPVRRICMMMLELKGLKQSDLCHHIHRISHNGEFIFFCIILWCHGFKCRQILRHSSSFKIPGNRDPQACCCSGYFNMAFQRISLVTSALQLTKDYLCHFFLLVPPLVFKLQHRFITRYIYPSDAMETKSAKPSKFKKQHKTRD